MHFHSYCCIVAPVCALDNYGKPKSCQRVAGRLIACWRCKYEKRATHHGATNQMPWGKGLVSGSLFGWASMAAGQRMLFAQRMPGYRLECFFVKAWDLDSEETLIHIPCS